MSASDVIIIGLTFLFIPKLIRKYTSRLGIAKEVGIWIFIGGIFWILLSCGHGIVFSILDVSEGDSRFYLSESQAVAQQLQSGDICSVIGRLHRLYGRAFYCTYQGLILYVSGGTIVSILAINALLAFWGGLVLTKVIYSLAGIQTSQRDLLPLFIIFLPSVVFWSSSNIKEALMYWSICHVFAFIDLSTSKRQFVCESIWFFIGAYVGLHIRSHIMAIWVVGVLVVKVLDRRFWKHGVLILLILLLFFPVAKSTINFNSLERNIERAEYRMNILIKRNKNSTFDYGGKGPIAVLSGLKNVQFRPFFLAIPNLRSFLTALEIWTITIGIIFLWLRMRNREWRNIIRNPAILVSFLVLIPFWLFFGYMPNEGLIARQRIQLFPALIVLFATPILVRRQIKADNGGQKTRDYDC